jgi:glycosyltransferase involved in cell wall biosynthesis
VVLAAGDPDLLTRVLRRWLSDETHRTQLRAAALSRRATLEPWSTTADRLRRAMCSRDDGSLRR